MDKHSSNPTPESTLTVAEVAPLAKAILQLFQRRQVEPARATGALQMALGMIVESDVTGDGARPLDRNALDAALFKHAGIICWFVEGINRSRYPEDK